VLISFDVVEEKVVKLLQGARGIPVNLKDSRPRRTNRARALGLKRGRGRGRRTRTQRGRRALGRRRECVARLLSAAHDQSQPKPRANAGASRPARIKAPTRQPTKKPRPEGRDTALPCPRPPWRGRSEAEGDDGAPRDGRGVTEWRSRRGDDDADCVTAPQGPKTGALKHIKRTAVQDR